MTVRVIYRHQETPLRFTRIPQYYGGNYFQ